MQTYVYVGVSARTGGIISGLFLRGADMDKWGRTGLPDHTDVHANTLHPDDPAVVYAATSAGLYRSQDLDQNWKQIDHSVEVRSSMMRLPCTRATCIRHIASPKGQTFSTWR